MNQVAYKIKKVNDKRERRTFSKIKNAFELQDLLEIQKKSYQWFLTDGIKEVLDELDQEIGPNSRLAFLSRLYLLINLRVPRTRHIRRLFMENWVDDYKTEQVLESTVLEVFNRYGGNVSKALNDNINN